MGKLLLLSFSIPGFGTRLRNLVSKVNQSENTNGLIRQYFPKGTDFPSVSLKQLREAQRRLKGWPRKTLGYYAPSERFYKFITGKKIALEV